MGLESYCTDCVKCRNRRLPSPLFELYFAERSATLRISGNFAEWAKKNCAEGAPSRAESTTDETPQLPPPTKISMPSKSTLQRSQQQNTPQSAASLLSNLHPDTRSLIPSVIITMSEEDVSPDNGHPSDQLSFASNSEFIPGSGSICKSDYAQTQLVHRAQIALAAMNCLALRRAICHFEDYSEDKFPVRSGAVNLVDELCMVHLDAFEDGFVLDIEPNGSGVDKLLQRLNNLAVERCKFVVTECACGKRYSSDDVTCLIAALEREHLQDIIRAREQQEDDSYVKRALEHFGLGHSAEDDNDADNDQGPRKGNLSVTNINSETKHKGSTAHEVNRIAVTITNRSSSSGMAHFGSPVGQASNDSSPCSASNLSPGSLTAWEQSLLRGSPTREEIEAVDKADVRDSKACLKKIAVTQGKLTKEQPQTHESSFHSSEEFNRRALAFPLDVGQRLVENPSSARDMLSAQERSASPLTKYWQRKRIANLAPDHGAKPTDSLYSESVYSVRQSDPSAKSSAHLRNFREDGITSDAPLAPRSRPRPAHPRHHPLSKCRRHKRPGPAPRPATF